MHQWLAARCTQPALRAAYIGGLTCFVVGFVAQALFAAIGRLQGLIQHDMRTKGRPEFYGYSIAYFDTNVYISLTKKPGSWKSLQEFLCENNLLLGVSDTNVLELSLSPDLHADLARFLLQVPSALLKPAAQIMEDEVKAYLRDTEVNPLVGPITPLVLESDNPVGTLVESLFQRELITSIRSAMIEQKPAFEKRIQDTRENFLPIVNPERYTENDGPYYAFQLVWLQILCNDWPICARRIKEKIEGSQEMRPTLPPHFKGLRLFALAQFYRYHLHRKAPEGNDYGDFLQVVPIPYCRVAVVEETLSNELRHIRRHDPVLQHTEVHKLDFLRELTGLDLG
ncbi:MAG: hypothetical protein SWK90_08245 [Chloroflexota bacterium]|nr:hypothetical protein [Chloroflexota bacterium]